MERIKNLLLTKSIGLFINLMSYANPRLASSLAYRFFSEPRAGRLEKSKLPEVLSNAVTESFSQGNLDFHTYRWDGDENVILLVHGWESNASRWEKMLPFLQKTGHTIVAIDGPAHGLSGGREFNLIDYATAIDIAVRHYNPKFLIGHSMGGAACIFYQYKYSSKSLRKMVLLGAPSDLRVLVSNYIALLSLNSRMVKLLEDYFLERFRIKLDDFSGRIFGKKIKIKGLVAHDIDDTVVSFEEGKKIAGSWKDAVFIETKGLGHSMHDDELYRKVAAFLSDE